MKTSKQSNIYDDNICNHTYKAIIVVDSVLVELQTDLPFPTQILFDPHQLDLN